MEPVRVSRNGLEKTGQVFQKGNVWAARFRYAVLWERRAQHTVTGRWGLISEKDHRSWRALWFILILMVMRSSLEDFRQRNDAKTSLAFDCFVSCLLVTNPIFSPWGTLFLSTLGLHDLVGLIPLSGTRLSTAPPWSTWLIQGTASNPNQYSESSGRLFVGTIMKDVFTFFWS